MSVSLVLIVVAVVVLALFWRTAMKSRENAMVFAHRTCKNWGVYLLDDTVALSKMRIRRENGRWQIWREYGFEFTYEGSKRYQGYLLFRGYQLEQVISSDVDMVPKEVEEEPSITVQQRNNVIDLAEYQRSKGDQ